VIVNTYSFLGGMTYSGLSGTYGGADVDNPLGNVQDGAGVLWRNGQGLWNRPFGIIRAEGRGSRLQHLRGGAKIAGRLCPVTSDYNGPNCSKSITYHEGHMLRPCRQMSVLTYKST